jgi:hypothetical protein
MSEEVFVKALACPWSELTKEELASIHWMGMNADNETLRSKIIQMVDDELSRRRKLEERTQVLTSKAPQLAKSFTAEEIERIKRMTIADMEFCCEVLRDELKVEEGTGTCSATFWIVRTDEGLDAESPDDPYDTAYPDNLVWMWQIDTYYPDGIDDVDPFKGSDELPQMVYEEKLAAMKFVAASK